MRGWVRRIVVTASGLLAVVCIVYLALFFLHRSGFIRGFVKAKLDGIPSPFLTYVGDAWIDLWGPGVVIEDLKLLDRQSSDEILKLPNVRLEIGLNPFEGYFLAPSRVIINSGNFTLPLKLLENTTSPKKTSSDPPPNIPEIWIRDLAVQLNLESNRNISLGKLSAAVTPVPKAEEGYFTGQLQLPVGPSVVFDGNWNEAGHLGLNAAGNLDFNPNATFEAESSESIWKELNLTGGLALRLWGNLDPNSPTGIRFGAEGIAKALSVTIPNPHFRLQDISGAFRISSNSDCYVDLKGKLWDKTSLQLQGKAQWTKDWTPQRGLRDFACDHLLVAENLPFDDRIREIASIDHTVKEVWDSISPEGSCDLYLRSKKTFDEPKIIHEPIISLRKAKITFRGFPEDDPSKVIGFPLPITEVEGKVLCQPERISIYELQGKMHDAKFSMYGSLYGHGKVGIDLEVGVEGLPFDEETRTAIRSLPHEIGEVWDLVQPTGKANLSLRLVKEPGPTHVIPTGKIELSGGTAKFQDFPLPVTELSGTAVLDSDSLHVDGMGMASGGNTEIKLALNGLRSAGEGKRPALTAKITAKKISVEDEVRAAMLVKFADLKNKIEPHGGHMDADLWLWRDATTNADQAAPLQAVASIALDRVNSRQGWFPAGAKDTERLQIQDLNGLIFLGVKDNETQIDLSHLEGNIFGAPFLFDYHAAVRGNRAGDSSELRVRAHGTPLIPELFQTLKRGNIPQYEVWGIPEWKGSADFEFRQKKNPAVGEEFWASIDFRDVDLNFHKEKIEFNNLNGEIVIKGNQFSSEQLSAQIGEIPFDISKLKNLQGPDARGVEFELNIPKLPLENNLENILPAELAEKLKPFNLGGYCSLNELKVSVVPNPPAAPTIRFRGLVTTDKASIEGGVSTENLDAEIHIADGIITGDKVVIVGNLKNTKLELLKRKIENLNAEFEVTENKLGFFHLTSNAYGGRIEQGDGPYFFSMELQGSNKFETNAKFINLNLKTLLRDLFPKARNLQGILNVRLNLNGNHNDLQSIAGKGEVSVENGSLWEVPVFSTLFRPLGQRPVFSKGKVEFSVEDQNFHVKNLELKSSVMSLSSDKGRLGFDTSLDVYLQLRDVFYIGRIPPFSWVLPLVVYHITGNLKNPIVDPVEVQGSSQSAKFPYCPDIEFGSEGLRL